MLDPALGGGALLDIGLYPIYLCQLILGTPKTVKAAAKIIHGVDVHTDMILTYKSAQCSLQCSFEITTGAVATINGTKRKMIIPDPFHHARKVIIESYDGEREVFDFEVLGNGFVYEIEQVVYCVENSFRESELINHSVSIELAQTIQKVQDEIRR